MIFPSANASFSFIDIKTFQLQKNIKSIPNYDLYEVSNTETSSLYLVKMSHKLINNMPPNQLINLSNELNIISKIIHPSILQFIGYSPFDFENLQRPVIITELASKEILGHIYENKKNVRYSIGWNQSKKYINIYGIASAMQYLHKNDIIHCNLNSNNVLLDSSLYPKITGFEFSRKITNPLIQTVNRFSKLNGVEQFLAPEVLLKEEYTKSSDVYSFSLIVYEIFTKKKPFSKFASTLNCIYEISIKRERPDLIDSIPDFYKSLIERCWAHDPKERPTFDEIVEILKENQELKNDKEYQSYIKYVDESPKTFDITKQFHQFDDIINDVKELSFSKIFDSKSGSTFDLKKFKKEANCGKILFDDVILISNEETGEQYTARISDIPFEKFNENEFLNFSEEVSIISQLNHPSIAKFISYKHVDLNEDNRPMIITEYCSNSTLKYLLEIQDAISKYDDTQKLMIVYGIALGMSYLHSNNIIHRNLKPENIFLDDFLLPKISGFQISKELTSKSSVYVSTSIIGTPVYLPPEIYMRKEYSKAGDVYSFSLLVYEIITNKKPFKELSTVLQIKEFVAENGKRPEFTEPIPDCWRELIERCWSQEPKERPTFEEIVNILRTDSRFITSNIQIDDFQNYVKYIDESDITFNPTNKVKITKDIPQFEANSSTKINNYISLKTVFDTEVNGITFDFEYLDINNFELQNKIGESMNVFKILEKKTGKQFAAKVLHFYSTICHSRTLEKDAMQEVNSISQINHPSFVKFIGYSPIFFNDEPYPTIIMELLLNRSIYDYLEIIREGEEIPEWNDTIKLINVYGIASGMAYLHSYDIIFRDLKPNNILLDDYLFPKIIDFGISRYVPKSNVSLTYGIGTFLYMAPESLKEEKYGKPYDVYSFAITVYEIITGLIPYSNIRKIGQIYNEVAENGKRPEFTEPIPDCWRELIERCWSQEPKERPTFEEIVNILRTDSRFITSNIQIDDFQNYVKYIDESQAELGYQPPKTKQDYITNMKTGPFHKVNIYLYLNEVKRTKMLSINLKFINLDKFEKQEKIGEGGFGTVYKVIDKKTGKIYAAKISIDNLDQCSDENIKNLEREVSIISKLNYPSIMKFIGFNSKNFKNKSKPTIITELLTNGSLDKIIELERMSCGNPDWDDTKKLINIYGIASGMAYLHSLNILHRDLKPANILLDDYLFPKISDFGLSKDIIVDEKAQNRSGFKGTCAYSAPEIFQGIYTKSGDVYAFAFIVYEIMTNEELFKGCTYYNLMQSILNGYRPPIDDFVPKAYQKLIESCWSQNPNHRPTFECIVDQLKKKSRFCY